MQTCEYWAETQWTWINIHEILSSLGLISDCTGTMSLPEKCFNICCFPSWVTVIFLSCQSEFVLEKTEAVKAITAELTNDYLLFHRGQSWRCPGECTFVHSLPGRRVSVWNSISRIARLNPIFKILLMYGVLMQKHLQMCSVPFFWNHPLFMKHLETDLAKHFAHILLLP